MLTAEDIQALSAEFDGNTLGVKVQAWNKERTRAMLVPYIQHTDAYIRLESVDPGWSCEAAETLSGPNGVTVRMKMTVKGVTRENAGDGEDFKSAYSDAIKRCAMLFGVGRYLYDSDQVWVPFNESQDKYRIFTYDDYKGALKPIRGGAAAAPTAHKSPIKSRADLSKEIHELAGRLGMSRDDLANYIMDDYRKQAKDLTMLELGKLSESLQGELGRKGEIA